MLDPLLLGFLLAKEVNVRSLIVIGDCNVVIIAMLEKSSLKLTMIIREIISQAYNDHCLSKKGGQKPPQNFILSSAKCSQLRS
jgi:hypothetical protein